MKPIMFNKNKELETLTKHMSIIYCHEIDKYIDTDIDECNIDCDDCEKHEDENELTCGAMDRF